MVAAVSNPLVNPNPFLRGKQRPIVVGHRGVPALHQENTLAGFQSAFYFLILPQFIPRGAPVVPRRAAPRAVPLECDFLRATDASGLRRDGVARP